MVDDTLFPNAIKVDKGGKVHVWYLSTGATIDAPEEVKLSMLIRADGDVSGQEIGRAHV